MKKNDQKCKWSNQKSIVKTALKTQWYYAMFVYFTRIFETHWQLFDSRSRSIDGN